MVPALFFSQMGLFALVGLGLLLHWVWPSPADACPTTSAPPPPKRTREPKPFAGLTHKPLCDACAPTTDPPLHVSSAPPPRLIPTRGRRRQGATSLHFCPNLDGQYRGWTGWGNLRANGHPGRGCWRQRLCIVCRGSLLETLGTLFHGKRVAPELLVRVMACLAEGLGIRGTARGFEIDPHTVRSWCVETADQLRAFAQSFLHDLHLRPVQLDA